MENRHMKKIKVQVLDPKSFEPFGVVISTDNFEPDRVPGAFDWYGELADFNDIDHATFNLMTVYPREVKIEKFECHVKTREAVIPLGGKGVIIPLSPPGEVTEDSIAAFYVPGNKAVVFHPGTWHYVPFTFEDSANFITAYRRDTSKDDVQYAEPPYPMELEI